MNSPNKQSKLIADWERLHQIFIRPEDDDCKETLVKYMEQILFGLHEFLNKNVGVTEEISLRELTANFKETVINSDPEKRLAEVISDIISKIAPRAVNVASPYFVGHMTGAIPFFMVHLKAIVAALNQNVIKLETSKVLSVLERQVIAKIHRLIYGLNDTFYYKHVQHPDTSLGSFTTGGTTANLTALWVARNRFFKPFEHSIKHTIKDCIRDQLEGIKRLQGVERLQGVDERLQGVEQLQGVQRFEGIEAEGIACALNAYSLDRAVVLISKRGHFSLRKSGGILGIGNKNVIPIDVNAQHRIDIKKLSNTIKEIKRQNKSNHQDKLMPRTDIISVPRTGIISVVGVAGATETGIIDPLNDIADICEEHGINFHVDAAWGGPVMLSEKYSHKLKGIERADSVTVDGHKQFFMPMTCGMVFFRNPLSMNHIAYHSNYVNREGSLDLGIKTLEGSREANSLILDSALKIMGTKGYALMIDHGIETAKQFADAIKKRELFELITEPELNILTYRMVPKEIKKRLKQADAEERRVLNEEVDKINIALQRKQREAGRSFVSRTKISYGSMIDQPEEVVVLRSVIMNPMTNITILNEVLDEQEKILKSIKITKDKEKEV